MVFDSVEEWVDGVIDTVAEILGEVVTSGTVLTLSFPEYILDSLVQRLDPITDPFLVAIHEDSERAEVSVHGISLFAKMGDFFRRTGITEFPTSVTLQSYSSAPAEVEGDVALVVVGPVEVGGTVTLTITHA